MDLTILTVEKGLSRLPPIFDTIHKKESMATSRFHCDFYDLRSLCSLQNENIMQSVIFQETQSSSRQKANYCWKKFYMR